MKQVCKATTKQTYFQQLYSQYHNLPPNLPLPNTASISLFNLSFHSIVYLDQIKSSTQDIQLKLLWWGMDNPQILSFKENSSSVHSKAKYIVCVPVQSFIAYLNDMKILNIEVFIRNRVLGRAYLNFLVMKGWRGERYDNFVDIKYGNKKIGQMGYQIQIITSHNPYLPHLSINNAAKISDNTNFNKNIPINGQESDDMMDDSDANFNDIDENGLKRKKGSERMYEEMPKYDEVKIKRSGSNRSDISIIKQHDDMLSNHRQQPYQLPGHKENINHNIEFHRHKSSNIHHSHTIQYQKQHIRLVQDYNILFAKYNPQSQPKDNHNSTINQIQIQIVQTQIDNKASHDNVQVIVPLINQKQHAYSVSVGAIIKIVFGHETTQAQLIEYLKGCEIVVRKDGRLEGSVKLMKVLARPNQEIEIALFEKKTKKDNNTNNVAKGRVIVKALLTNNDHSPQNRIDKPSNQNHHNHLSQPSQHQNHQKPQRQFNKEQYALFTIRKYHSIHPYPHQHTQNLFVQLYSNQELLATTKTIWNHTLQECSFEEHLTLKVNSPTIMIWLCDRKQNIIKLGYGLLDMKSSIGIDLEIPILSLTFKKQTIIGYLSFDYMRNGLESISKIPALLQTSKGQNVNALMEGKKDDKKKQVKENIIDELKPYNIVEEQGRKQQSNDKQDNEYQYDKGIRQMQEYMRQKQKITQQHKQQENKQIKNRLSLLQIYNQLFTFIYTHPSIIQISPNPTITQFLSHLQPHLAHRISSLSLNQIILHKLSPNAHTVNTASLQHDFQSFCTYYEQLVQQKDNYLFLLLNILDQMDLDVNALEYQLKKNKTFWNDLNTILSHRKGNHINLIQHIRKYYTQDTQMTHPNITIQQFCDALRQFQVYQTTKGQQISPQLISSTIYHSLVELLISSQPYIEYYSFEELQQFLNEEQIILSEWEMLNLQKYINSEWHQRYLNQKVRQMGFQEIRLEKNQPAFIEKKRMQKSLVDQVKHEKRSKKEEVKNVGQGNDSGQYRKGNEQQMSNKATMTKSPTFGYLHPQPQNLKKTQLQTSQKMMVQSLALKMQNLPISPINYTSNKTIQNQPKALFSNLKYLLEQLYINHIKINISHHHYNSQAQHKSSLQQEYNSSKEKTVEKYSQLKSKQLSNQEQEQGSWMTVTDAKGEGGNLEVKLWNVFRQFEYVVNACFMGGQKAEAQCVNGQWTALVSDDGQYLGTILIS